MPNIAAAQGHAITPSLTDNVRNLCVYAPISAAAVAAVWGIAQCLGTDMSVAKFACFSVSMGIALRTHEEVGRNPQNADNLMYTGLALNASIVAAAKLLLD